MSTDPTAGQSLDQLLSMLVPMLGERHAVYYTLVSSLALLAYEYLLTVSKEVDLVWRAKWGTGKILFLLNRYSPPIALGFELAGFMVYMPSKDVSFCTVWDPLVGTSFTLCVAFNQAILAARTWAIWGGEKRALYGLCGGYLISLAVSGVLVGLELGKSTALPNFPLIPYGCLIMESEKHLWAAYVPSVCYETVIFVLTVKKALNLGSINHGISPMLATLIQHGLGYYAVALALALLNMFVFAFAPLPLLPLGICLQVTLQSILCTRLLLSIRETNRRQSEIPSEWETVKFSLPPTPAVGPTSPTGTSGYFRAVNTAPSTPILPVAFAAPPTTSVA
ncbi:hypothetical protein CALCODRAFT_225406 [Calocera cornea HHB12733]|uniref:DUF6533 domain-containing protein n=1 Tax=Calocera cornea HHB12733 TaxID=1353952 RepID=A0A165H6R8_9BASI|nr:hypothetical protein CALCODRAFT_225406 [Calocera cornea HHB12733]